MRRDNCFPCGCHNHTDSAAANWQEHEHTSQDVPLKRKASREVSQFLMYSSRNQKPVSWAIDRTPLEIWGSSWGLWTPECGISGVTTNAQGSADTLFVALKLTVTLVHLQPQEPAGCWSVPAPVPVWMKAWLPSTQPRGTLLLQDHCTKPSMCVPTSLCTRLLPKHYM